jgi:hypothetical protein
MWPGCMAQADFLDLSFLAVAQASGQAIKEELTNARKAA